MIETERLQAKAWMVMNKMKAKDIQKALGMRYHTQVIETLSGVRNDRRVLKYLKDQGCPEDYLRIENRRGAGK